MVFRSKLFVDGGDNNDGDRCDLPARREEKHRELTREMKDDVVDAILADAILADAKKDGENDDCDGDKGNEDAASRTAEAEAEAKAAVRAVRRAKRAVVTTLRYDPYPGGGYDECTYSTCFFARQQR